MGTLWIKDFRIGLDSRKGELALRPGTLLTALNGYITQGGEFTKRKAMVPPETTLPAGCFGLQSTSSGLLTFGSDATPAGFPNFALQGALLNYTRLQHPAVLAGTTYDAAKHAMTSATLSENFGGYAWVVATFADGRGYPYYNGTPVYDFIDGLVLPDRATTTLIATDLIAMINRSGRYTATSPGAGLVNIEGPLDTVFELTITENAAAGAITNTFLTAPVTSTLGVTAKGQFNVCGGSSSAGVNKINSVVVNGVTITSGAVDWTTDNQATAALIAANINAFTSNPEYTADTDGATVLIYAALAAGDGPNGFAVVTNCAGNFCVGDFRATFQGTSFEVLTMNVNGANILTTTFEFGPGTANTYTTLSALVAAIVTNINANTTAGTAHGYLAFGTTSGAGAQLFFSKAATSSADADITAYFTINVPVGWEGQILYDNPVDGTGFTAGATPTVFNINAKQYNIGTTGNPTGNCTVFTPNAPQLYTFSWRRVQDAVAISNPNLAWNITADFPNERITKFRLGAVSSRPNGTYPLSTAIFVCDVTDLNGFTVTTNEVRINVSNNF